MRVYIPFQPKETGGPSVFAQKLEAGLVAQGSSVSWHEAGGSDAALVIINAALPAYLDIRRHHIPMAVRLDGVYTPASTPRWRRANLKPLLAYRLAQGVVFQSQYSRWQVERYLGRVGQRPSVVVYNGVDLEVFQPDGPMPDGPGPGRKDLFTASVFRHEHQLKPLIEAMGKVRKVSPHTRLFVAGPVREPLQPLLRAEGVVALGPIGNADLPRWLRAAGVFAFASLNPPCPNVVIEALACGCPVAGYRTGAMGELVGRAGFLAEHPYDNLDRFVAGNPAALARAALDALEAGDELRQSARRRAVEHFGLPAMCAEYLRFLQSLPRP